MNLLEIFNEGIVIVCNYHLLIFVNPGISMELKYRAGWSLDLIIIVQFIFNCYIYFKESLLLFKMYARAYYLRIRALA